MKGIVYVPVLRCTICEVPYVLRYSLSVDRPPKWVYQPDCEHKSIAPRGTIGPEDLETATVHGFTRKPFINAERAPRAST